MCKFAQKITGAGNKLAQIHLNKSNIFATFAQISWWQILQKATASDPIYAAAALALPKKKQAHASRSLEQVAALCMIWIFLNFIMHISITLF